MSPPPLPALSVSIVPGGGFSVVAACAASSARIRLMRRKFSESRVSGNPAMFVFRTHS
jgi:hypothetical protein